jgi:hypothetical protein
MRCKFKAHRPFPETMLDIKVGKTGASVIMRFPLSWERRAVYLINSKKFKQVREKLNLSGRLAQLDWASHN